MINFGYTSRSMKDPDAYEKLVKLRLDFKAKAKAVNKEISAKLGGSWYHDFSDSQSVLSDRQKKDTPMFSMLEHIYR